jgi:hypothetical protein
MKKKKKGRGRGWRGGVCVEERVSEEDGKEPTNNLLVSIVSYLGERNCCETKTDWFSGMEAGRMGAGGTTGWVMVDEIGICGWKYKHYYYLCLLDDQSIWTLSLLCSVCVCVCVCVRVMWSVNLAKLIQGTYSEKQSIVWHMV